MYKAHPNLFVFFEKLKEFQTDTYLCENTKSTFGSKNS
jgi:hypothetical protein